MSKARRTALREVIYGPEEISAMRSALDKSWDALAFAAWRDEQDIRLTRERLATAILRQAASGERSVSTLTNGALGAIEPRRAGGVRWPASESVF